MYVCMHVRMDVRHKAPRVAQCRNTHPWTTPLPQMPVRSLLRLDDHMSLPAPRECQRGAAPSSASLCFFSPHERFESAQGVLALSGDRSAAKQQLLPNTSMQRLLIASCVCVFSSAPLRVSKCRRRVTVLSRRSPVTVCRIRTRAPRAGVKKARPWWTWQWARGAAGVGFGAVR